MKSTVLLLAGVLLATTIHAQETNTLKAAFRDNFLIGAALNPSQFCELNPIEASIVKKQFNSISPENVLKWESVHPLPGKYDFALADKYVDFGKRQQMFIIGHTLIWHEQTPGWVFKNEQGKSITRQELLTRMRDHIFTVVGRFKGKINGWDVVNEALDEQGKLRESPWRKIIGDDYIQKAFEFAHEADPQAELYYNDYGLENTPKRMGALSLINRLRANGAKIDGVGIQEHVNLTWPTNSQLDQALSAFGQAGIKIMVTELDVDVLPKKYWDGNADVSRHSESVPSMNPYSTQLPEEMHRALANRYSDLFKIYLKHDDVVKRITFWGVTDGNSWLNNWPISGRTSYPLLFDHEGNPKPCFSEVMKTGLRSRKCNKSFVN